MGKPPTRTTAPDAAGRAAAAVAPPETGVPAFARGPVLTVAAAVAAVLLVTSGRYGYFGDELYFLAAGRRLDWGYADQPPLLPLLAQAMDTLAPGSLTVLRLPAVLATVGTVVLTALIARELGGGRRAQVLAAAAAACSAQLLGGGHYLATSTLDPFLWTMLLWLLVRWVRTRDDRLLLWAGVVTGIALNVKFLVPAFWVVAGLCLLACGPRELLRRPALAAGAVIALLAVAPTVVWQAANDWPQLDMGAAISTEVGAGWGGRLFFLPSALSGAGLVAGAILLVYGVVRLLRSPRLRPYRFLGWTVLGLTVLFLAVNGRYYYVAGMFGVCWAAAAVEIERARPARWWRWLLSWPSFAVSGMLAIVLGLPVLPIPTLAANPAVPRAPFATEEIGWPQVTTSVADAYRALPPQRRERTGVVTEFYWQAGAVDRYGPALGLPEPHSGNRGYWALGRPDDTVTDILYVGWNPGRITPMFGEVRPVGALDNGHGVLNSSQGMPIWLATDIRQPWSAVWPRMREMGV
ncbi:glycosyl transferase, family 39 [Amycolatopsis antarctica]|uniref:Glycosyl transferase, family 39 n=1 Tax=Amycolatopsis antarctica TaxID=1854586 RepID=A0A263D153_9PSEU|nr:glycosyltransferase family 39 protein [Amycolatopsis antarctica]OZM72173.1 glycosyl transferase, family 39 [Amycolatopsis antarctica]